MKYMLLIYSNPAAAAALRQDLAGAYAETDAIVRELRQSGEWIGGEVLADPVHTRTIRVRGGVPVVTDGPFVEAKEHLAGYCLFDCESLERAEEIAARWPDARYSGVELRPLMDDSGTEM